MNHQVVFGVTPQHGHHALRVPFMGSRDRLGGAPLCLHTNGIGTSTQPGFNFLHVPGYGGNRRLENANLRNRQVVFCPRPQQAPTLSARPSWETLTIWEKTSLLIRMEGFGAARTKATISSANQFGQP